MVKKRNKKKWSQKQATAKRLGGRMQNDFIRLKHLQGVHGVLICVPPLSPTPVRFCPILFPSKPVVRAIQVSHAACKDEFRQNPRSHSCRFLNFLIRAPKYHCCSTQGNGTKTSCRTPSRITCTEIITRYTLILPQDPTGHNLLFITLLIL